MMKDHTKKKPDNRQDNQKKGSSKDSAGKTDKTERTAKVKGIKDRPHLTADTLHADELEKELERERYKHRFYRALLSTVCTLIVIASIAVLVANLWLPVLRVSGDSMTPTFQQEDIVVAYKTESFKSGDLIAFYYNNKILVKRVIATSGQWINIAEDGTVYVDDIKLDEPYLDEKAFGDCNINLPYQVPESRVFVMGDHRSVSLDSRNTSIGCVASEQIIGKIFFRIWPMKSVGKLE